VYDRLCASPLARHPRALAGVIALLLAGAAYGFCNVYSGRGAFLHFGALLGTIMVANVFFVIIPGQRELVKAKAAGRVPDPAHGLRGKQRSVHNTYFTLPVLFAMISNHYAMSYGAPRNWLVLVTISVAGAALRSYFVARHQLHATGRASPLPAVLGVLMLCGVAFALAPRVQTAGANAAAEAGFVRIQSIVGARCAVCHAASPTQAGFNAAPKGVMLDSAERILAQTSQMRPQLATRAMPIGNLTHMTDEERAAVLAWIDRGAPH